MSERLQATDEMCAVCFDMLIASLRNEPTDSIIDRFLTAETQANIPCPVFVTWKIGRDKDLRGCIGTFDKTTRIGEIVPRYALVSALSDSRFDPISLREVEHLSVSVSLLTNFTPIEHPLDWEVGTHGIQIDFRVKGNRYSGTFLPEVSKEQGWDQATTLVQLFRKAGYKPPNSNRNPAEIVQEMAPSLSVITYQSSKKSMTYARYQAYRGIAN
ncbi:unnamed protein product [Blepharisma stoltei]|uniref:AMMECR1 domain-containing protein n=1 Tax=Blepharisma stoltei TaxID=1481888 RepID=A0AAU9ILN5_9CILI|nr:unnamed protein product [Blepharisma stoltei]